MVVGGMIRVGGPRGGRVVDGSLLADPVGGSDEGSVGSSSCSVVSEGSKYSRSSSMSSGDAEASLFVNESSPVDEEEGSRSGLVSNVTRRGFSIEAVFGLVNVSSGR